MNEPRNTGIDEGRSRVVAVMGSYHESGTIAELVEAALGGARAVGARTETIVLADRHVEFCLNCRECMQHPGEARGRCVQHDDAAWILDALDNADAVVLAAPVNFNDVNALTRRLLERMVVYGFWPREAPAPKLRRRLPRSRRKPALLVTSSAAPSLATRLFARSLGTLKRMAALMGARPFATLVSGLSAGTRHGPSERELHRARRLGERLAERGRALHQRAEAVPA